MSDDDDRNEFRDAADRLDRLTAERLEAMRRQVAPYLEGMQTFLLPGVDITTLDDATLLKVHLALGMIPESEYHRCEWDVAGVKREILEEIRRRGLPG